MSPHDFLILLVSLLLYDQYAAVTHEPSEFAPSEIDCTTKPDVCKITNLYQSARLNGSLHLLLEHPLDVVPRPIKLGIGYLSPVAWFDQCSFSTGIFNATSYDLQFAQLIKANHDGDHLFIPIFIHTSSFSLGNALGDQVTTIEEPSLLGMPLWRNIMRIFYSAASSIFSALELKLINISAPTSFKYFYAHSEFFLQGTKKALRGGLANEPPFAEILESITKFPLEPMFPSKLPSSRVFRDFLMGCPFEFPISEMLDEDLNYTGKDPASNIGRRNTAITLTRNLVFRNLITQRNETFRSSVPVVTIVKRSRDLSRNIINMDALVSVLRTFNCTINIVSLENLSIGDQIATAYYSDIFIAVHGAGMIHSLWMRPGTVAIEIFPIGFRKAIYRNLIGIVGGVAEHHNEEYGETTFSQLPLYLFWQEQHRLHNEFTDLVDWNSMLSKEIHRKKDIFIHIPSMTSLLRTAFDFQRDKLRFLLFAPWEQLNNQVQELVSACAMAQELNRILLLPKVGYKKGPSNEIFEIANFQWQPFKVYFDSARFSENPFCFHIDEDNFFALLKTLTFNKYLEQQPRSDKIIMPLYNQTMASILKRIHLTSRYVSQNIITEQTVDYYRNILAFPSLPILDDRFDRQKQNYPDWRNYSRFYNDTQFLLLGNMFYFYDFGPQVTYPQLQYIDFLASQKYANIRSNLIPRPEIKRFASILIAESPLQDKFLAIHLRRGDYYKKCVKDLSIYKTKQGLNSHTRSSERFWNSCWQSSKLVRQKLVSVSTSFNHSDQKLAVYISTNVAVDSRFVNSINKHQKYNVWSLSLLKSRLLVRTGLDVSLMIQTMSLLRLILFSHASFIPSRQTYSIAALLKFLDPNVWALVDHEICSSSHIFVGNRFSSFTRSIVDSRGGVQNNSHTFFF